MSTSMVHACAARCTHKGTRSMRPRAILRNEARAHGSPDNLTVQIVRIDTLPTLTASELQRQSQALACPPPLQPRMTFEGYRIVRELQITSRSHVHLADDIETGTQVVLKTPSIDLQGDPAYLRALLDGRLGGAAHRQRACAEALRADAPSAHFCTSPPNTSKARRSRNG